MKLVSERARLGWMFAVIVTLHVVGFALLFLGSASGAQGFGIGTGVLAYSLGLRHAFDADHIAAIDNTTRKLMNDGKRPVATGFFFSLGHSTVVFALAMLLGLGLIALGDQLQDEGSRLHHYTGLFGAGVSGGFLLLLSAINVVVLWSVFRMFLRMRTDRSAAATTESFGIVARLLRPLMRSVTNSSHMYFIGLLFGLGFDTATEIGLLILAASSAGAGMPVSALVSLPVLFAAGMCLLDTINGSFMIRVYGWALAAPVRKVYFNLVVTGLSVAVAAAIGALQIANVVSRQAGWSGGIWEFAASFDLNRAGFLVVAIFGFVWVAAVAFWRFGRIEERWSAAG